MPVVAGCLVYTLPGTAPKFLKVYVSLYVWKFYAEIPENRLLYLNVCFENQINPN